MNVIGCHWVHRGHERSVCEHRLPGRFATVPARIATVGVGKLACNRDWFLTLPQRH